MKNLYVLLIAALVLPVAANAKRPSEFIPDFGLYTLLEKAVAESVSLDLQMKEMQKSFSATNRSIFCKSLGAELAHLDNIQDYIEGQGHLTLIGEPTDIVYRLVHSDARAYRFTLDKEFGDICSSQDAKIFPGKYSFFIEMKDELEDHSEAVKAPSWQ